MTYINDLEICARIAEIEGLKYRVNKNLQAVMTGSKWDSCEYNPLEDDALCFQLMVKYETGCSPCGRIVYSDKKVYCAKAKDGKELQMHTSPNKAICLAIIEAHKDD